MIKRIILSAIIIIACGGAVAGAAGLNAPGADRIGIRNRFETAVSAPGVKTPAKFAVVSGRLPYGLRLTTDGRIIGYPTAVERTSATLTATGADGKTITGKVLFTVKDDRFRLMYRELPVVKTGGTVKVKIEAQGGAPVSCEASKARVFFADAAKWGGKSPYKDGLPSWMKIGRDCSISASPKQESVTLLVISATDASGATTSEFFALRAAKDIKSEGWLERKAREYNLDYQKRFSPNGLTLEINDKGGYHAYGDSAIWTGTYLGGAAFYFAVTGEKFARENVEKALNATTQLRLITGVPGLIARAFEHTENSSRNLPYDIQDDPARNSFALTSGPYKGWRFLSTASRDQFTGVFWGNAILLELFDDPSIRGRASENIVSMSSHIWDHKMHIVDVDGKHTRHGVMSGYGIQESNGEKDYDPYDTQPIAVPNGMNSAMLLNWFDMAAAAATDTKTSDLWRGRYLALIAEKTNPEPGRGFENSYIKNLKKVYIYGEKYNSYWETVWFNLNLFFNNYYHLARLEKDASIRRQYLDVMKYFWEDKKQMEDGCENPPKRRAGREHNPHFTWQYLAAKGDREPDRIFNAVTELMLFPHGPKTPFVPVDPMTFSAVPGHPEWACEPIPVQYRKPADFLWQREPYYIVPKWPSDGMGRQWAGVDVITPYWMGRYFGFIPSNI
ncbi:MAG TPA: Ig domain-containing protein [bacterium]|nr:Ig domain-containing protein [bacterium]